jgi:hypothetical protein
VYVNTANRLIVEGGEFPALKARIWMITRTVVPPPTVRDQDVYEEVEATGTTSAVFALNSGPSLVDETAKLCGLSLHEEGQPAVNGPIFRFGDVESLPTPFPDDPEGYIDCTELPRAAVDLTTVASRDWPFTALPLTVGGNRVVTLTVGGGTGGRADLVASGDLPAPWSYTMHLRISPSWEVFLPSSPFAVDLDPAPTSSGPISGELRRWLGTSVLNAYMSSVTNAAYDTTIRAHAAIVFPPVKPFLISGVPPPDVVISVRRVGVDPAGLLEFWPTTAGFGNVTSRLFPPHTRDTSTPLGCLLGPASGLASRALSQLFRGRRAGAPPLG